MRLPTTEAHHVAFTPLGKLLAGIWNPRGYINQPARAGWNLPTSARVRTDHTGRRRDSGRGPTITIGVTVAHGDSDAGGH